LNDKVDVEVNSLHVKRNGIENLMNYVYIVRVDVKVIGLSMTVKKFIVMPSVKYFTHGTIIALCSATYKLLNRYRSQLEIGSTT
jgi:hypothetical protein